MENQTLPFELEENEEAKTVNDYPDYYITSHGRLYSNKHKRFIGHHNKVNHYEQATLQPPKNSNRNHRATYIHELVLEHFGNPKPGEDYEVDHRDGITTNNNIDNLQWLKHQDNLLKRRPYKQDRKQRLTKDKMNQINKWMIENEERLNKPSNEKIAKLCLEELNIDVNLQTIRLNRGKWKLENDKLQRI